MICEGSIRLTWMNLKQGIHRFFDIEFWMMFSSERLEQRFGNKVYLTAFGMSFEHKPNP